MGDPRGFLDVARRKGSERPVAERTSDYREIVVEPPPDEIARQASRCMDCGIPFCHRGCPLENVIPEWNHLVYRGRMDEAADLLLSTNNFPEVTGRVCPAPCEASCVLNIQGDPVTIKDVERTLGNHVLSRGLVPKPFGPIGRSSSRVAVIGSGPAGLAAAQELARMGHSVSVFEKDDRIGGLLRYGIPDFKMQKDLIDRRIEQMSAEGVKFFTGKDVGVDVSCEELKTEYDAVVLAMGARAPRDLDVPGRDLEGVHFAMDFLCQQNRRVAGDVVPSEEAILATDRQVVVLGGGDTGSDCVGTSNRQRAASVSQLELMPKPSLVRMPDNPWPAWPLVLRTSSSHEEGCERDWGVMTRALHAEAGSRRIARIEVVRVELRGGKIVPVPGSESFIACDLLLLAMGFVGPEPAAWTAELGLARDPRGNIASDPAGRTSVPGFFAAGDVSRGQSLVVWAIADGRRVARGVDAHLRRRHLGTGVRIDDNGTTLS